MKLDDIILVLEDAQYNLKGSVMELSLADIESAKIHIKNALSGLYKYKKSIKETI